MEFITKVFQSGNSQAIQIPEECKINTQTAKIIVKDNFLIIQPIKNPSRKGWNEAFKKMRQNNDDTLFINDVFENDIDV